MRREIPVRSSAGHYPIIIEPGLRRRIGLILKSLPGKRSYSSVLIVTDRTVEKLYLEDVVRSFDETPHVKIVPAGEQSKSFSVLEELLEYVAGCGLDRDSVIIALGGGVVGDLAGFAAASFMRGIDFIQVPTTLLAHDSSVGGKTGINLRAGKNLAGAFHPPAAVCFDPETFSSLSKREWRSGLAEVIKHGLIRDPELLSFALDIGSFETAEDGAAMGRLLEQSIRVKKEVVEEDEKEKGIRAYLNFGHTLAHAVEAEAGYGRWTHGEAVAAGMIFALELSERTFGIDLRSAEVEASLQKLGYDTRMYKNLDTRSLVERMKKDKKSRQGDIRFVLLKAPCEPVLMPVSETELLKHL
ncbi:3-dehydroquinate synthase [Alteribacter lacisalsi]|uniref:3-dehydroquinate synthase n=1 Tax=Alteribacter lacisalsi TaxID=2045244 RepID=A0A2W0HMW4_9BACI|nr:3-dehydroquinate synthase [Alteribacter lacisalsi]PYZ98422.1 3-dehydroquinate synthase [Alteribacter lacisalsi]